MTRDMQDMDSIDVRKSIGFLGLIAFTMGSWSSLIMLAFTALHLFDLSLAQILSPWLISIAIASVLIGISMYGISKKRF